jgi:hypothetical protein
MQDRLLRRRLTLGDGTELRTVGEPRALLAAKLGTKKVVLEPILLRAMKTGKRADVGEATRLVESMLREAQLMQAPE